MLKSGKSVEYCSSSTLITDSKTFHIRIISTISLTNQISCPFGKLVAIRSGFSGKPDFPYFSAWAGYLDIATLAPTL
jgi:hypothetical protein